MSQTDLFKIKGVYNKADLPVELPNKTFRAVFGHHPTSREVVFLLDETQFYGFVTTDPHKLEEISVPTYCYFCDTKKNSGAFLSDFKPERESEFPVTEPHNFMIENIKDRFICEDCLDQFLRVRGHILADQR